MQFRELLISLAITVLTGVLLFLYFKNRIFRTEQKVDLMFQLIQEHERTAQLRHMDLPFPARQQQTGGQQQLKAGGVPSAVEGPATDGLIQISDDEEGFSDDSSEESDSDEEGQLKISNDTSDDLDLGENIKTISLSLSGAETNKKEVSLEDVEDLDDVGQIEEGVGGENEDADVAADGDSSVASKSDAKVEKLEEIDYMAMNMTKLKAVAAKRGLSNYKGLRKPKLVELLKGTVA